MFSDDEQTLKDEFDLQGYVALKGFLPPAEIGMLQYQVFRFVRDIVPKLPADQVFYEDKSRPETLKQIQHMEMHDAYFTKLFSEGKFPELAARLLGEPVIGKNMQYFNKPPGVGQPTPAHQDGYYFKLDPPQAVTMWLALDRVDEVNGCVRYVAGSHRRGMREHAKTGVLGFSQGIVDYGLPQEVELEKPFPAEPGDLLVHHALTIHRADGNQSRDRTRRSIGFIYYGASAKEDRVAADSYQAALTQELAAAGKI